MFERVFNKEFGSLLILVAILSCLSMGAKNGCTSFEKTAAGAGLGAALGAGIGALVGDPGLGAAIGAGVGGLGGAAYAAMTDDQGNTLTEEEMREARTQRLEMKDKYDSDLYVLRITRDANNKIRVVPEVKPQSTKELQFVN